MLRKRMFRGVAALVLALGLFVAAGAQAAEGPPRGLTGFWTNVEAWFLDLAADWLGAGPTATASATGTEDPDSDDSEELPTGPWTLDGGDRGETPTTDTGPGSDPDG